MSGLIKKLRERVSAKELISAVITGGIVFAAVFLLGCSRGYLITRCLCDGLFVAAVILVGIGGLKGVRNQGMFDVAEYGVKYAVETAIPSLRHGEKRETMADFRARKTQERRPALSLVLVGCVFLILSFVSLAIYNASVS